MTRAPSFPGVLILVAALLVPAASRSVRAQTAPAPAETAAAPLTISGELTVLYADDFARGRSELVHVVRDPRSGRSFQLRFEGPPPALRHGQRVTVTGRPRDARLDVLALQTDPAPGLSPPGGAAVASTLASGEQRTLVIAAAFADAPLACPLAQIDEAVFSDPSGLSVDALYCDASRGQLSFSGLVVGPYPLPFTSSGPCDIGGWALAADAAASAAGVDVASFPRRVYVLPGSSCPAAGYGTLGGATSRAWIFACGTKGVYAHELGHNLGMDHASTPTTEYGDVTDPMGYGGSRLRGLNAPHRDQLGWLAGAPVQQVTASGDYDLAPLALDPAEATAPQAITIGAPDGDTFYLAYRRATGFDAQIDGRYLDRLSVHRFRRDGADARTFLLAGLADGESFADATAGLQVTMLAHSATHATVRVALACPASPPALTLSPASQTGPAGAGRTYVATVTHAGLSGCAPRTIALAGIGPPGWQIVAAPASLTLNAGASGQSFVTVTPDAGAAPGAYTATITATDAASPMLATSGAVSHVVEAALDVEPPSAPSGLASTVQRKQLRLTWQASTDNVGVAGYVVLRNGAIAGTAATTNWIDPAYPAGGITTYAVAAFDAAGNHSAPGAGVTVGGTGGGRKK